MFDGKSILITGGTGSFGMKFCEILLKEYEPERLIVYSRDEFKQGEMAQKEIFKNPAMRYFLGDVRDKERLRRAMDSVDIVIHAAALKQVPAAEYNPMEFIKTNIIGTTNVVDAALDCNVKRVITLSTDKAVNPLNLYGATKLCSDKLFIAANNYRGKKPTAFSVVRYGNIIGSRGSVIPLFKEQKKSGVLTLTHPEMTRFYISLEEGVRFVLKCVHLMQGGEVFIPKIPTCLLKDVAMAIAPEAEHRIAGIRPGEKMHEMLIPVDEAHRTLEYKDYFMIEPMFSFWQRGNSQLGGTPCDPGFYYSSSNNDRRLSVEEIRAICDNLGEEDTIEVKKAC